MPNTNYVSQIGDVGEALRCLVTNEIVPADGYNVNEASHIFFRVVIPDRDITTPDFGKANFMENLIDGITDTAGLIKREMGDAPIVSFPLCSSGSLGSSSVRERAHFGSDLKVRQLMSYDIMLAGIVVAFDLAIKKAEVPNGPIRVNFRFTRTHR